MTVAVESSIATIAGTSANLSPPPIHAAAIHDDIDIATPIAAIRPNKGERFGLSDVA
jgi:hypothetical protein